MAGEQQGVVSPVCGASPLARISSVSFLSHLLLSRLDFLIRSMLSLICRAVRLIPSISRAISSPSHFALRELICSQKHRRTWHMHKRRVSGGIP